jgi:outer membrane protein
MRNAALLAAAALCCGPSLGSAQTAGAGRRLTLAEAVQLAARSAPTVATASYRVEEAQARARQTRATLLPSLTGTAGWFNRSSTLASTGFTFPSIPGLSFPALIGPYDNLDARFRLTQTLFDYAGWAHLRADRLQVDGSAADHDASIQAAARAAAAAYLRAVRAVSLLAARQADADVATELLSLAEAQLQAGVSAPLDVTRARTQLAAARAGLIVARNQRQKADIDLALALGADPATAFVLADTLTGDLGASSTPADTAAALALALARRQDLAAEEARIQRAEAERGAISAERLPRLDLAADYGPNGKTPGTTLNTRQIAVMVTIPLLDGFRREARRAEQGAVARESEVRAQDLRRQIAAQVRAALLDFASGVEQHDVAAQRLALAEEELSQARERFASGIAGNIDLITAQSSLNQARDAEIDARYATASARVGLAFATGVAETVH